MCHVHERMEEPSMEAQAQELMPGEHQARATRPALACYSSIKGGPLLINPVEELVLADVGQVPLQRAK